MYRRKVRILMGSKSDQAFATSIGRELEKYGIHPEYDVASAHRESDLDEILKRDEVSGEHVLYVTVAGLSDGLSGRVAGHTQSPVIACPPDSKTSEGVYNWDKIYSCVVTPRDCPVLFISDPEKAALAVMRILKFAGELYE